MTHPERVAVIAYHSSPLDQPGAGDSGGMNVYVRETAARMGRSGVGVDIFTRRRNDTVPQVVEVSPGVRLVRIPAGPAGAEKAALHHWVDEFALRVRAFAQTEGSCYERVISHYWLSGLAGLWLSSEWRAPHVSVFHTLALAKGRRFSAESFLLRVHGERTVVQHADVLAATGQDERRTLTMAYGAASRKVRIVSPGVDRSRFFPMDRQECRRRLGLPADRRYVFFAARRDSIKGLDILLKALDRMAPETDLQALIAGGEAAPAGGGRARFLGSVGHDRMPLFYGAADFCVAPSYYDSFGMAALEAQACGRAVIASDVGGLSEVVRDGVTGLLVTPGRPDELAGAMRLLLEKPAHAEDLGTAGTRRAARYSWERTCNSLLAPVAARSEPSLIAGPVQAVEQFAI